MKTINKNALFTAGRLSLLVNPLSLRAGISNRSGFQLHPNAAWLETVAAIN